MSAELQLINKVEMQLALANDNQLQNKLELFLPPLLLKLSSDEPPSRQAVLRIIQQIVPRINATRDLKLPLEALLKQAKDNAHGDTTRAYSLVFVSKGLDRITPAEAAHLFPLVVDGIATVPEMVQARLFNVMYRLLMVIGDDLPPIQPADMDFLSKVIASFFLLGPDTGVPMPGLSIEEVAFFNSKAGTSLKSVPEIRAYQRVLLKFLKHFDRPFLPLLVATAHPFSGISDEAEMLFRKMSVDYEDKALMDLLVGLFLGTPGKPAVPSALQERIMRIWLKSVYVTTHEKLASITKTGLSSNTRLKQVTIKFIQWVGINNEGSLLTSYGEETLTRLKDTLMSEGWPRMDTSQVNNYATAISQRLGYYESIGSILRTCPDLLNDPSHLEFLFSSLESDVVETRPTIQDVLSKLGVYLPQVGESVRQKVMELAREYLSSTDPDKNVHGCRYISIKYINSLFPFENPEARLLCILGSEKTNRVDTIEEAMKGLHPHWFNILQSSNTTQFRATPDLLGENSSVDLPSFSSFVTTMKKEETCLDLCVNFAFECLVMEAIRGKKTVIVKDEEWRTRLHKAVEVDERVRDLLVAYMKEVELSHMKEVELSHMKEVELFHFKEVELVGYIETTFRSVLTSTSSIPLLFKLLSFSPDSVIGKLSFGPQLGSLLKTPLSDADALTVAKCFGIVMSHPSNDEAFDGSMLGTACLLSRLVLRNRLDGIEGRISDFLVYLKEKVHDPSMYYTVIEAASQLAIYGAFGPVIHNLDLSELIEVIQAKVKKCDEKSTLALAHLSLAVPQHLEQMIFDTHVSKQVEFTFSSGEALAIMAAGWDSKCLQRQLDISGEEIRYVPQNTSKLPTILSTVLEATSTTKPSLRKAGCLWLLSLVQFCGHINSVQEKSNEIHLAFMKFLADKDELVQESASRGLSLIYEMGDRELKDTLVHGLLKSFTSSKQTMNGTVEHDTELFQEINVNDANVSTYKDVLNLAQDVGDPSLVYKFMSLAKSSALWSSRKGMAFGLGSILSRSSLDELLANNKTLASRLIPKLYRYRFDPNTSVQQSMTQIWNTLIKDPAATVKENFDIILKELLKSLGNREWRVRQASAAALNDLLHSVPYEMYESQMEDIWGMSFRAIDDIKESVRNEGSKLTKSLATMLTRMIDTKSGSSKTLDTLIPFLLGSKGLLSDSDDIKQFSLDTILKLCKTGSKSIQSFVPTLIDRFVQLMSSLEPEAINYLVLNADKYNLKNSDIDSQRLQSLGHSPMFDAIERLLALLDESILGEFMTRLENSIKRSVGLPSKVCGSKVLVILVTKHYELIRPYGDKLLKIAASQLSDRNDTIASAYATSAGHVCKIASIKEVVAYASNINALYFESDDDRSRELAATASECVSKYSGDKFAQVLSAFLPLVFIGKCDTNEYVSKTFEREWIENTNGSDKAIVIYLPEVLGFLKSHMSSSKFEVRRVLGRSLSKLALAVDDLSNFSNHIDEIFTLLMDSLQGKSWEGKEVLLGSLVSFAIKGKTYISKDLQSNIEKLLMVEVKRRNKNYQQEAVKLLGQYVHVFHNDAILKVYMDVMDLVLSDKYHIDVDDDSDDEAMDIDKPNLTVKENIELETKKISFLQNLQASFTQANVLLDYILEKFYSHFHSALIDITWRSKVDLCDALNKLVLQLVENDIAVTKTQVQLIHKNVTQLSSLCLDVSQIEKVKVHALRFVGTVLKLYLKIGDENSASLRSSLEEFNLQDDSPVIKTEIEKLLSGL